LIAEPAAPDGHGALTRILLVRHGQTDWNVQQRVQGQLDVPLNATGRAQAQALAQALQDEALDAIYSSDLMRAWETAAAVAAQPGRPTLQAEIGLRERRFGGFEGLSFLDIETRFPADNERWRSRELDYAPGGSGETLHALAQRSLSCVARLVRAHPGRAVLLVSHGGVLDALYRAAQGIGMREPRHWTLGNAHINRLLHDGERLSVQLWGDGGHLEALDAPQQE
jgi:2,3-bisphosphoglycerate-dependent phosphoglycerate mutase